jgi:uncharacterized membrane protein
VAHPEPLHIEIRPNCALSARGAQTFFISAAVPPLTIAVFLSLHGFWPVLPFAGLELLVLAWALRASLERRHYCQSITVTEDAVSIRLSHRGGAPQQVVFPRHWARVKLRRPAARLHPSRLLIESHGRQCELGSFLTEEERRGLALRLQRLIGRTSESPAWP